MTDQAHTGPQSEPTTFNILFVCTGNTCRSPMAAAIACRMLEERGWRHVTVQSAGIAANPGAPATGHAVHVAAEKRLDLGSHAAQVLTPQLVGWADLVLVMGPSHLAAVCELGGVEKVALVTDFQDGDGFGAPIEDPYGGDEGAYRRAFDQLTAAIEAVLTRLEPILAP